MNGSLGVGFLKFVDENEPDLAEVAYTAELVRDLDAGDERMILEASKPMLQI
jgi:hypothetical protein